MGLLRVDAAIGEETEEMQFSFAHARVFHGARATRGERRSRRSGSSRSMRVMSMWTMRPAPMLRWPTSLLPIWPFRKADEGPAGMDERVGIFAQQAVVGGLAGECDGVGFGFGAVTPAVEDDENERFWMGHECGFWLLASGF